MAHAEEIDSLLESLIEEFNTSHRPSDVDDCKRSALKIFASSDHARTNQFEVDARLEGLAEKFRIVNREDLADALDSRVHEVSQLYNQWTPEALSFLLHLSDRPSHQSTLEHLTKAEPKTLAAPLTWAEINLEGSVDEDTGLWENIDFAGDSSSEASDVEYVRSGRIEHQQGSITPATEDLDAKLQQLVLPLEKQDPQHFTENQYWRPQARADIEHSAEFASRNQDSLLLTELQAEREVIFMLLGLPTTIYARASEGAVQLSRHVLMNHVSSHCMSGLLNDFAVIGGQLDRLRSFANRSENLPLVQTFQATLCQHMRVVDCTLNEIQSKILDDRQDLMASLLGLYEEVSQQTRLIRQLDLVVQDVTRSSKAQKPFRILERLFEKTCSCHSIADLEAYEYIASIFFECFRVYSRPIRLWMETGQLTKHDQVMFVKRNASYVSPASLWNDQFSLVYSDNGDLCAPKYLHLATKKIFNTGKSTDFLKQLGFDRPVPIAQRHKDDMMSFDAVCRAPDPSMLCPFAKLFNAAFDRWIGRMHHSSSSLLRIQLEQRCGLQNILDALEYIYFFKNSAVTDIILTPVFDRIDNAKRSWNDPFALSALFQGAFATVSCVDVNRIGIKSVKLISQGKQPVQRSMSLLEDLCITYNLPWPIANVIRPSTLPRYQRVFVFLSQVSRAKHLLHRHKLPKPGQSSFSKSQLHHIYSLRTQLLFFVNIMLTHLTTMVLDPCTAFMRAEMARAEDVDAMISAHATYIDKIVDQCLLAKKHTSLKQAIVSVLDLTVLFADLLAKPESRDAAHVSQSKSHARKTASISSSEDEGGDQDESPFARLSVEETPVNARGTSIDEKLKRMQDNFTQLLTLITASVQGQSKSDGAAYWEILASNLTAGLSR
ncbi:MAG: hypothetical protein Q9217_002268 [Psora testacea]